MAVRGVSVLSVYSSPAANFRVILTTSQVDQVSHADLVSKGDVCELATDWDESLILDASEALVGENNGAVTATSREAVMERQSDGLASVVGAVASLVDELVLQLPGDVIPDVGARSISSVLQGANDPGR